TEVHPADPRSTVQQLLTLQASGGTNIEEVLKHIKQQPSSYINIVLTDGICDVDQELARQVASTHKVIFCIMPPSREYPWLKHFKTVRVQGLKDLMPSKILS
ncbi:MAG: hypothetical protein ACTSXC_08180, partial [Candidatus Freyarchaeota archaeon]